KFTVFYELPDTTLTITSFVISEGNIWIGTSDLGFYLLKDNNLSHLIPTGNVTSIYKDSDDNIWIGTLQHGCYVIADGNVVNYRHDIKDNTSIASDYVRAFSEDD